MKNRVSVISVFVVLTFALSSCGSKTSTNSNATSSANATASNSNTKAAKTKQVPKPITKITNEEKPEGQTAKTLPPDKKVPVPEDSNEEILDMIWGNFEMYSGGASGTS